MPPVLAVGWPATTMTFKATPPAVLQNVHVGQSVAFDMRTKGEVPAERQALARD